MREVIETESYQMRGTSYATGVGPEGVEMEVQPRALRIGEEGKPETWDPTEPPVPAEVPVEPAPEPVVPVSLWGRAA